MCWCRGRQLRPRRVAPRRPSAQSRSRDHREQHAPGERQRRSQTGRRSLRNSRDTPTPRTSNSCASRRGLASSGAARTRRPFGPKAAFLPAKADAGRQRALSRGPRRRPPRGAEVRRPEPVSARAGHPDILVFPRGNADARTSAAPPKSNVSATKFNARLISSADPPRTKTKSSRYGNRVRTVIDAPIEAAAIRGCLFRAKPTPPAIRIAPVRYPHTLENGTHDGVITSKGTPGANSGCRKCSTAK